MNQVAVVKNNPYVFLSRTHVKHVATFSSVARKQDLIFVLLIMIFSQVCLNVFYCSSPTAPVDVSNTQWGAFGAHGWKRKRAHIFRGLGVIIVWVQDLGFKLLSWESVGQTVHHLSFASRKKKKKKNRTIRREKVCTPTSRYRDINVWRCSVCVGWNHPGWPIPRIVSSMRKAGELCSGGQILMFGWQPLCSIITLEEKQMHSSACWEGRCLNHSLGKGVRRDKTQLSSRRLWTWVTSQCRFPSQHLKRTRGVPKRRHFIGSVSARVFSDDVSNFISLFLVMSHASPRIPLRPHLFHKERSSHRLYSALLVPCCQVSVWVSEATVGGGGRRPLSTNACGCRANSLEFTPDCVREAMRLGPQLWNVSMTITQTPQSDSGSARAVNCHYLPRHKTKCDYSETDRVVLVRLYKLVGWVITEEKN